MRILTLVILLTSLQALSIEYAAVRGAHRGSARTIAMGGAFAGVGDDADALWSTAAMIPLKGAGIDLFLTQSQALGLDYATQPGGPKMGLRQEYSHVNFSYNMGDHMFGVSFGSPYKEGGSSALTQSSRMEIKERRFVYGYKFAPTWAFATTFMSTYMEQEILFQEKSSAPNSRYQTQQVSMNGYGLSLAKHGSEYADFGISYESERTYGFDPADPEWGRRVNSQLGFLNARVPEKWRLGVSYKTNQHLLLSTEIEALMRVRGMTSFIESMPGTQLHSETYIDNMLIPHFGAEWYMVSKPYFRTWLRGGLYYEPPFFRGMEERYHRTIGFQTKAWLFSFSFAYDSAESFSHFATSISISLSDYI